MSANLASKEVEVFTRKLGEYKKIIDTEIENYSKVIQKTTLQEYGVNSRIPTDALLDLLARGGKRIRGSLAIAGYEMLGGKDKKMITQAACALEMVHAYLLIMDDIQDRSEYRRGKKAVHIKLADYHHSKRMSGSSYHFGVAIALNAMGISNHIAQVIITELDVPNELKLKALKSLNQTVVITAHGQTSDIVNEVNGEASKQDIENVLEWKTAYYTVLNPLTFGMILAGASDKETKAVKEYAMNTGRAFQITDDILGTFGTEFESGKSPSDDIKEGKRTLLTFYALEHANNADKNFLIQMLGNQKITQSEFYRCKDILIETGALDFATKEAKICIDKAVNSIKKQKFNWEDENINFLVGLAQNLINRSS